MHIRKLIQAHSFPGDTSAIKVSKGVPQGPLSMTSALFILPGPLH